MATTSNGPVPTKHVFLYQIPELENDAKIRVMCHVLAYSEKSGELLVEHNYPRDVSFTPATKAMIDMNLILETIHPEVLQTGSWINIIGYTRQKPDQRFRHSKAVRTRVAGGLPEVQAVLAWSAGAVRVDNYEKTIERHLALASTK